MTGPVEDLFFESLVSRYVDDPRFVERPWLSEALTGPLHDENCRFVLLTGEPGAGKTGIVARLARTNPSWLRYFIRWDSITPLASGDARSLLLAAGHQLAVRRPELFAGQGPDIRVEQQADEVAESGQMVGISIDEVSVSPFRKVAFSVKQKAGTASGEIVGLRIRSLNLEPRLLDLATLCEMALSEPGRAAAGSPSSFWWMRSTTGTPTPGSSRRTQFSAGCPRRPTCRRTSSS
ncbi:ATP-binding protein [Paractinoplanes durhamensis]|uniref:ATP-binding protein n=1 Tax=Paractinoplanes durhamensis TaxID=113563 RepID=UPI00363E6772